MTTKYVCICTIDDFGMGHGENCPVGRRNKLTSIKDICERLVGYEVPDSLVQPIKT